MYSLAALLHPVFLERVRMLHSRDQQSPQLASQRSLLLRSLFVVSLMCRHFDFDQVATEVPLPDLVSGADGPASTTRYAAVRSRDCGCRLLLIAAGMLKQILASYGVVACAMYVHTYIHMLWYWYASFLHLDVACQGEGACPAHILYRVL